MNQIEKEHQEIMEDLLHGPPVIHICILNYQDGSSRAFTFSIEENLKEFIQYVEECGELLGAVSYVFHESLLDAMYDHEYKMYSTEH